MKSYQKIMGNHKPEVEGILEGNIIVEEKIDGSQFRIQIDQHGNITCGSHHQELSNTDSNFNKVVQIALQIFDGTKATSEEPMTIFAEYMAKPKQNAIAYERIPKHFFIVFDIHANGRYLNRKEKMMMCDKFQVECVPALYQGPGEGLTEDKINELLARPSVLGHQGGYDRLEGIVIKNYDKKYEFDEGHSLYGHFMCSKIVNDSFKEKTRMGKPRGSDKLETLKASVCTEARWRKAVQHLEEKNELTHTDKDIGILIREIMTDLKEEEEDTIKDELFKLYGKDILKASTDGFVKWYQSLPN